MWHGSYIYLTYVWHGSFINVTWLHPLWFVWLQHTTTRCNALQYSSYIYITYVWHGTHIYIRDIPVTCLIPICDMSASPFTNLASMMYGFLFSVFLWLQHTATHYSTCLRRRLLAVCVRVWVCEREGIVCARTRCNLRSADCSLTLSYTHTHIYSHTLSFSLARTHTPTYTHTHIHTHPRTHTHTYIHTHAHAHMISDLRCINYGEWAHTNHKSLLHTHTRTHTHTHTHT